jgi:hypothetical protein
VNIVHTFHTSIGAPPEAQEVFREHIAGARCMAVSQREDDVRLVFDSGYELVLVGGMVIVHPIRQ